MITTLKTKKISKYSEKNNQNILVQKLANLASTGDDNVSYKRAIERINRRQLDEIGTDRSKEKPINLLKKQKARKKARFL